VQLDFGQRELTIKLVYYGPALSGKTTNLQSIHRRTTDRSRGRLMTLETRDDRTLFFDLLPIQFKNETGLQLRLKLFTVPGQVMHDATRRLVLQSVDGVAFVADSRQSETKANADAFQNLKQNLRENGLEIRDLPLVIQFNKRDLPDVRPDAEIRGMARRGREPVYLAVATRDEGTVETFLGLVRTTWQALDQSHDLASKFAVQTDDLMARLVANLGLPAELARADA
jgi:mutual gliding-motility protein MglA